MAWLARWTTTQARLLWVTLGWFAALLLCAILCGELLRLAERPHGSTALDSSITSWMVAHRAQGWTTLAHVLSTLGSQAVLTPLVGVVALALLARRRFVLGGLLIAAWGGAILLYSLTKQVVHRPRPPSAIWLTDVGRSTSFPSGHAVQSLATFVALGLVGALWLSKRRWAGWVPALILAAGVGWSRVYLGVHWTSDVLAGWLIAAAWITIVLWLAGIARRIEQGRRDEPGRPHRSANKLDVDAG
ncbi:MAG TPA: phosphatase PAP2 family protein [Solirubrobacteraceae bacterium]|nr:phosphatase PAP2 family protein [Solirubrobacteraceae bacterium]